MICFHDKQFSLCDLEHWHLKQDITNDSIMLSAVKVFFHVESPECQEEASHLIDSVCNVCEYSFHELRARELSCLFESDSQVSLSTIVGKQGDPFRIQKWLKGQKIFPIEWSHYVQSGNSTVAFATVASHSLYVRSPDFMEKGMVGEPPFSHP